MKPLSRLHLAFALVLLALLTLNLQLSTAHAQGTAFIYQGQLQNTNGPVHGTYKLTFTLFNTYTSGVAIAGPVTNNAVLSTNGLFTVSIDFGSSVWNGQTNWLQIAVETNGAATFTNLSPRQQLMPVPYAIYAENAGAATIATTATSANNVAAGSVTGTSIAAGTITAANIASGQVVKSLNGLHDAVTLAAGNNITLNTNGNTLTVSSSAGGTNGSAWGLTGNAGTMAATNFVGTTDNQPLELHVDGQRALRLEPTATANTPNVIGGSVLNSAASAIGAVISGGYSNSIAAGVEDSSIGGGTYNNIPAGGGYSTIGGGDSNTNAANSSAVSGGYDNLIQSGAGFSIIGGGDENLIAATSASSIFDFEDFEDVYGSWASLAGGLENTIDSAGSFIGGGYYNEIDTNSTDSVLFPIGEEYEGGWSVIGGGAQNTVSAGGSFIGGGGFNWIEPDAMWSAIAGGEGNIIDSNSYTYVFYSQLDNPGGGFSLIGGGAQNKIRTDTSFIGGGYQNDIDLDSSGSVIAGGSENIITNSEGSFIGGGGDNLIFNDQGTSDEDAFPGDSTIGGGTGNAVLSPNSTIAGGYGNVISNGVNVTISGGAGNKATGNQATIPGGAGNMASGQWSFAAGYNAQATNDNSFVWSDNRGFNGGPAMSTGSGQFIIGAAGGVAINTSPNMSLYSDDNHFDLTVAHGIYADSLFISGDDGITSYGPIEATNGISTLGSLTVYGSMGCGADFGCGGSITAAGYITANNFGMSSDRNLKEHFTQINPQDVLAKIAGLPITEWNYKATKNMDHIGPMAQDFHAAFGLNGSDDKHISVVDEGGVALAAIQGLNQKLDEKDSEIQKLKQQNDSLAERLDELEATVKQLAAQK